MDDGRVLRVKFKPGVSADKRFKGVVRILTDLIEDGMRDEQVRLKAVQIIKQAGVKGHDEVGELRAIKNWVQQNCHYVKDPFGVEFFFTARRQIKDIEKGIHSGDCDDFVILGGALLGSLGYPVGALIVDSNNDGTFNHVMLVTKTFSPTRQFGNNWIPIELIYPQFKLGESVPISKVYPLMAHADTVRAPVTKKVISGIKGLMGAHPVGQLAGFGLAKDKVYDMGDAETYGNYTGEERSSFQVTDPYGSGNKRDPDNTKHYGYQFSQGTNYGKIKGISGRILKVSISAFKTGKGGSERSMANTYPVSFTLATKWNVKTWPWGGIRNKTPGGDKLTGSKITVTLRSASDYVEVQKDKVVVKKSGKLYKSSQYDSGWSSAQGYNITLDDNKKKQTFSIKKYRQSRRNLQKYFGKSPLGSEHQGVHHAQTIDPKHSAPIADYLGIGSAKKSSSEEVKLNKFVDQWDISGHTEEQESHSLSGYRKRSMLE